MTTSSILVIGGGFSGITAALEAAELGHEVFLVEKNPFLGGRVAQLNKYLPADAVIVPISTTSRNMRRRGYDHMRLIAKDLARKRNIGYSSLLRRRNNVVQHATRSSRQRKRQAKEFFEVSKSVDQKKLYVIIDDIFTTGSTLAAAADCLRQAGAENVQAAVIARHGNI